MHISDIHLQNGSHGHIRDSHGSHGQSWAVMGSHGQSWEELPLEPLHFWIDSHGQSWAVMGSHGIFTKKKRLILGGYDLPAEGRLWLRRTLLKLMCKLR